MKLPYLSCLIVVIDYLVARLLSQPTDILIWQFSGTVKLNQSELKEPLHNYTLAQI